MQKARVIATVHPSSLLRIEDKEERHRKFRTQIK